MRVLLDTNILVSAMLVKASTPGRIYLGWLQGSFVLLTCKEQLAELRSTLRKPAIAKRVRRHEAGRLINNLKSAAIFLENLPEVCRSPDPEDDFLLAAAEAGGADYLVTGDKSGLLSLARHRGTRIICASEFAGLL